MSRNSRSATPRIAHDRNDAGVDFAASAIDDVGRTLPGAFEIDWHELRDGAARIVDVRSPAEFAEDHIPGARSVPLFDDDERVEIGTLYRQRGPAVARRFGAARVGGRLHAYAQTLVDALELDVAGAEGPRVVCCARGGQRSGAVTQHLRELGFPVLRLAGGYRAYRTEIRNQLAQSRLPRPFVLNGLTGCGKTRVLRELSELAPGHVLDLEGLAGHRSSVLGDIGLEPVSQKRFEAALVEALGRLSGRWMIAEWEARRIGNRQIPTQLYEQLRAATQVELRATMAQRVEILTADYVSCGGVEEVSRRLPALASYPAFGDDGVRELQERLARGEVEEVARVLLEQHYDPRYLHGNREFHFETEFELADPRETAEQILHWVEEVQ